MDPLTIAMLAILAVLIFFMFRNGQKRKRDQEALRSKMVVGADVMTNFGLFGTILDIDEENNKVELQAGPGVVLTVHRQTVARVVEATTRSPTRTSRPTTLAANPATASPTTRKAQWGDDVLTRES